MLLVRAHLPQLQPAAHPAELLLLLLQMLASWDLKKPIIVARVPVACADNRQAEVFSLIKAIPEPDDLFSHATRTSSVQMQVAGLPCSSASYLAEGPALVLLQEACRDALRMLQRGTSVLDLIQHSRWPDFLGKHAVFFMVLPTHSATQPCLPASSLPAVLPHSCGTFVNTTPPEAVCPLPDDGGGAQRGAPGCSVLQSDLLAVRAGAAAGGRLCADSLASLAGLRLQHAWQAAASPAPWRAERAGSRRPGHGRAHCAAHRAADQQGASCQPCCSVLDSWTCKVPFAQHVLLESSPTPTLTMHTA